MGLERYVKLTTAAKLCGMDKRTLLSRLEKMGYVVPSSKHHHPIMVREVDVHAVMKNCAVLPSWLAGPKNPATENLDLDWWLNSSSGLETFNPCTILTSQKEFHPIELQKFTDVRESRPLTIPILKLAGR